MMDASQTERLIARTGKITRQRPPAPREVRFAADTNQLTWKPPADKKLFTHFRVRVDSDGGEPDFEVSAGQTSINIPYGAKQFWVSTYNEVNRLESVKMRCSAETGVAGDEAAPSVLNFAGAKEERTIDGGTKQWRYSLTWTEPTGARSAYVAAYVVRLDGPGLNHELVVELPKGTTAYVSTWRDIPTEGTVENYKVWLPSKSKTGAENSLVNGVTPSASFTVQFTSGEAGVEYTSSVTLLGVTAQYPDDAADGSYPMVILATFVKPADPTWGGVDIVAQLSGATKLDAGPWQTSPALTRTTCPDSVVTWDVYLVSRDKSGRRNSITVTTPKQSLTVGSASGMANGAKLRVSSVSTVSLDAQGIQVGGGGGKPGVLQVSNASGNVFGFIGMDGKRVGVVNVSGVNVSRLSGDAFVAEMAGLPIVLAGVAYTVQSVTNGSALVLTTTAGSMFGVAYTGWTGQGIWGQQLRAGGTSFANAKIKASDTGVDITDVTLELNLNGVTTSIKNFNGGDYTYCGFSCKNNGNAAEFRVNPFEIKLFRSTGQNDFWVDTSGGNCTLTLSGASGGGVSIATNVAIDGHVDLTGGVVLKVSGNKVVGARLGAIGSANTSHSCASFADVNAALNAMGTRVNTIKDRMGASSGHGLTSD